MGYDPQNDDEVTMGIECWNDECDFSGEVTMPSNEDDAHFICPECGFDDTFSLSEHFDYLYADQQMEVWREREMERIHEW